jgi:hypothetical protein
MFTETEIEQFDAYLAAQVRRSMRSTHDLFSPWGRKELSDEDILPDFSSMARSEELKSDVQPASVNETKVEKKPEKAEPDVFEMLIESAGSLE